MRMTGTSIRGRCGCFILKEVAQAGSVVRAIGVVALLAALSLAGMTSSVLAQAARQQPTTAWPTSTVRIICPYAPGAFTDTLARLVARELSDQIGQPVIVENRTGAAGVIALEQVAKSPADGHTLLITENSFAIAPAINAKLPYDPRTDFKPVSLLADLPSIWLARPQFPAKTVKEIVELAKASPGKLNYGSSGRGSTSHLAIEYFMRETGIQMQHVPFRGAGASIPELLAGRIDLVLVSTPTAVAYVKAGSLGAIALTGTVRAPALPNVPTFTELGYPSFDVSFWFGLFAPGAIPDPIVSRLEREIATALQSPRIREAFEKQGARTTRSSSAEFTRFVNDQIALWKQVVTQAGLKFD